MKPPGEIIQLIPDEGIQPSAITGARRVLNGSIGPHPYVRIMAYVMHYMKKTGK